MKHYLFCYLAIILFYGCSLSTRREAPIEHIPEALQENKASSLMVKRGSNNLLHELYQELLDKDSALNALEQSISETTELKGDSLKSFTTFDRKNESYYFSAHSLVAAIPDSGWRKFADSILKVSNNAYTNKISAHKKAIETIEASEKELESIHALLKLAYTLPLITRYQQELPPLSALENYRKQLDSITDRTKQLSIQKMKTK